MQPALGEQIMSAPGDGCDCAVACRGSAAHAMQTTCHNLLRGVRILSSCFFEENMLAVSEAVQEAVSMKEVC